jgi:lysine 2,3-aminomutase
MSQETPPAKAPPCAIPGHALPESPPRPAPWRDVPERLWNDWHWQVRNAVRHLGQLETLVRLTDDERAAVAALGTRLPMSITPFYASLIEPDDPDCPIRRTLIPTTAEHRVGPEELNDPCGEDADTVVPGLVHRYPDRVLFLALGTCAVYCRYCTRSRMVGGADGYSFRREQWGEAVRYIAAHPEVRDVLISGGDPLLLEDHHLDDLLSMLRAIPHLEIIRIGTKIPAVLPQRVTPGLTEVLRKYHPFMMSLHFVHPAELVPEVREACERLADAGIPLGSQTVLLKGINDDPVVMTALMHRLLRARVRPYYLYQCDPIQGSAHFRTPVRKGIELIESMRGHTSGYAVPTFVIDGPGGGGKIPVGPNYVLGQMEDRWVLRNYANRVYEYQDPELGPAPEGGEPEGGA